MDLAGNLRLGLALVALVVITLPLVTREGWPWWGLVPVAILFVVLGKWQERGFERRRWLQAAARFYQDAIDRIEERWRALPDDGADLGAVHRSESVYADDLDLFGPASLFQLLNRTATRLGRRALGTWLVHPADRATIEERQAAVGELAPMLDIREALIASAAGEDTAPIDDLRLLEWAEKSPPIRGAGALAVLGIVQPSILIGTAAYVLATDARPVILLPVVLVQIAVVMLTRRITNDRVEVLSGPDRALSRYARLIAQIEEAPLTSALGRRLKSRLTAESEGGAPASAQIRSLHRLVDLLDARLNMFFALSVGPALMWDLNLVLRAERFRVTTGKRLRVWLEAIGDIEALASLAAFAAERQHYAMPSILEDGPTFKAERLAHPLIDQRRVVANDIALETPGTLVILSGSNMSGKSTLLRSVGINTVLAFAGAPVAARSLALTPMTLMTSVRIFDSLAGGTSHFYAELKRIKAIVDAARAPGTKVLYLLDEMLHGTNSRERYLGALSVIRWLSGQGAIGIVTTHDLALAALETELPPGRARNMHFGDEVVDGEIRFDYKLKPGTLSSTNALRLMKAVGIDVELKA